MNTVSNARTTQGIATADSLPTVQIGTGAIDADPAQWLNAVDALYRFAAGQDLRDAELLASAFTPDAELDFVQPAQRFGVTLEPFRGRDAIVSTIRSSIAALQTTHTVTNPRLRFDDDGAELVALVEAQHVSRTEPQRHLLLKNIYLVRLVPDGPRWSMRHVRIHNVWWTGDARVLFP